MATAFAALADPHRRQILDLLRARDRVVSELVDQLGLSRPGVSKHLRTLREAGLVTVRNDAQWRWYGLCPEPLAEVDDWLAPYRAFWSDRLDALERHIAGLDFRGLVLDDGPVLRLERSYDQPAEQVWRALTEPDELRHWLPGEFEIRHSETPHLLIGTWHGEETLRFELRSAGQGCALTFTNTFADRDQAALTAADWDRRFARLGALLAGQTMSETASLAAWPDMHERYAASWGIDPDIGRPAPNAHPAEHHHTCSWLRPLGPRANTATGRPAARTAGSCSPQHAPGGEARWTRRLGTVPGTRTPPIAEARSLGTADHGRIQPPTPGR